MYQYEKTLESHYEDGLKCALKIVQNEARKILASTPELKEFVMAMGTAFFTTTNGDRPDIKEVSLQLSDFIYKYDNIYGIMGVPMRFTATGKTITNW